MKTTPIDCSIPPTGTKTPGRIISTLSRFGHCYVLFSVFALGFFAVSPHAAAVCREGCDSGLGNTFLGEDALISDNSNTKGSDNTAIGYTALFHNTTGNNNTATGSEALY